MSRLIHSGGNDVEKRFATATGAPSPSPEQIDDAVALKAQVLDLAHEIDDRVPNGRWKSLALTSLEEALMWVNKAIFNESRS